MSGHSKWSQIKHQKAVEDVKKGKLFSKLAQEIGAAAKGSPDLQANAALKGLIEKARAANMPKENIERAIARASDSAAGGEEFVVEAYASQGESLIIKGRTDSKNRSLGEIRVMLNKYGGKPVSPGNVSWNFEGETAKITRPASPSLAPLLEGLRNHPDVTQVLTDAIS